ncbi:MAG TPA: DinB family protein [Anaerolineales bacterium]
MKEITEYRMHLIERLVSRTAEFRDACLAVQDPFAPLEQDGWNTHQVAAHSRDVNLAAYGMRARRTAQEDNPEFPNFDGDAYMKENYRADEPLKEMMDGFVNDVEGLAELLKSLSPEAWSRESRHVTLGSGFTLQTWVERGLAHIEEHLKTVKGEN